MNEAKFGQDSGFKAPRPSKIQEAGRAVSFKEEIYGVERAKELRQIQTEIASRINESCARNGHPELGIALAKDFFGLQEGIPEEDLKKYENWQPTAVERETALVLGYEANNFVEMHSRKEPGFKSTLKIYRVQGTEEQANVSKQAERLAFNILYQSDEKTAEQLAEEKEFYEIFPELKFDPSGELDSRSYNSIVPGGELIFEEEDGELHPRLEVQRGES